MDEKLNRTYKDRLFSFLFGREENKAWTLSLYNAVNGTDYKNADEIEINTIENVLYMGMKNDVSFILDNMISLYEQQSTFNPNMPVRQLMYLSRLYEKYISDTEQNIFSEKQIQLPVPRLITFYNGEKAIDDQVLKLSSSFSKPEDTERSDVEVKVHLINIRPETSKKLLTLCKPLREYSWLIDTICKNKKTMKIEAAVDKALEEMPADFEIRRFLMNNRVEVKGMLLTEYDEAKTMQMFKEEGREQGRKEGILAFIEDKLEDGIAEEIICAKLIKHYHLTEEKAKEYIKIALQTD